VVWTLLDTGLRISELAGLVRGRIDVQNHCLYGGEREPHDGAGTVRAVPLTPRIEPLLESWFGKHESLGLCSRSIQRVIKDAATRAGLSGRVSAQALRDTFAVAAVRMGKSPLELQLLLGHKHLASTAIYFCLAREAPVSPPPRRPAARIRWSGVPITVIA
jgi:site-specific recombinase XerD